MSWKSFEEQQPELAAFGAKRLNGKVAYLATVRKDGSPRVHPVTPIIGEGHLFVFMEPTSPKGYDLRRDGRYVGRTVVHALEGTGNLRTERVEVAAVDGVCLTVRRSVLAAVGGFDEGYGFFHGYDRELSFAVREAGHRCVVVNASFVHRGGGTRTGPAAPVRAPEDLAQRQAALRRFATRWGHRLPADVRGRRERLTDWLVARARPT